MDKFLEKLLNFFNRFEVPILLIWTALTIIQKLTSFYIHEVMVIVSSYLSMFYFLQARMAITKLKEKPAALKVYPIILGYSSAILVMGILFKSNHYPGAAVMANVGMAGILLSSLFLFYTPIQDEYLPVMRKLLLRFFLLISLGFLVAI